MLLYTFEPALLCKFFPTTLSEVALTWYTPLPIGSIHTFVQLEDKFLGHFIASRKPKKSKFLLLSITQQEGESISSYLKNIPQGSAGSHGARRISCPEHLDQWHEGSKIIVAACRESSEDIRGGNEAMSKLRHSLWDMSGTWPYEAEVRQKGPKTFSSILKK